MVPGGIAKGAGAGGGPTLLTVEGGGCCTTTGADNGLGVAPWPFAEGEVFAGGRVGGGSAVAVEVPSIIIYWVITLMNNKLVLISDEPFDLLRHGNELDVDAKAALSSPTSFYAVSERCRARRRRGDYSKYISANRNDNMNMYKIIPHATPVITQQEEKRCASNTSN